MMVRFDREGWLEFLDYNQPGIGAQTPFSFEQLHYRMHVQTPDGQWHTGYFGWVAILSALPRWRWLARVLRRWPFRRLGPRVYQFVANHRYRVPRILLRWLGAPAACPTGGCAV